MHFNWVEEENLLKRVTRPSTKYSVEATCDPVTSCMLQYFILHSAQGNSIVAVFSSKSNPLSHGKGTNPSSTAVYSLGSHKAINPLNRKRGRNQCVFHFMLFHKKKKFSWAGKLVACFQIARFSTRPQNSRGRRKMKYSLRNVVFPGEDRDKWCCLFLC